MDLEKKIFAVITGASQGIGRCLAIELAKCMGNNSSINLIARNAQALNDVKATIVSINCNINVNVLDLDLTNPDITEYEKMFNVAVQYDYAIIFHNAGQVGPLNPSIELIDIKKWRDYFDLNLFSVGILNSVFVKRMRNMVTRHLTVVNVSSLCATKPQADMAMYCTGKAARNIYFKVFAVEESDVKVLNYCPGPVDTAMVKGIIADVKDESTKKIFVDMKDNRILLAPIETVKKLLALLRDGNYQSGDSIDYYDI